MQLPQWLSPRTPNHDRLRGWLALTHKRQTRLKHLLSVYQQTVARTLVLKVGGLLPLLLEILFPFFRQHPFLGELGPLLRCVVAEVKWHVFKAIFPFFALLDETRDGVA